MNVYRGGKFEVDSKYDFLEWKDNETDDEWKSRNGIKYFDQEGSEFLFEYQIYDVEGVPELRIFEISNADRAEHFVTETFGDYFFMLARLKRMLFHSVVATEMQETISKGIAKFFEAWHGHEFYNECDKCDRAQMRLRRAAWDRRQMEKKQN